MKEPTPQENSITPSPFTVEKFNNVQIGDSWEEVKSTLGDPFAYRDVPYKKQTCRRYFYSKPKDAKKKYAAYDIVVDKDGKVFDKSIIFLFEE